MKSSTRRTAMSLRNSQKRTNGHGVDAALEAVGATDPIKTAIACVRKGGTVTLIGNISPKIELPLQPIVTRRDSLAGLLRFFGRIPRLHRAAFERRHQSGHDDQRAESAG